MATPDPVIIVRHHPAAVAAGIMLVLLTVGLSLGGVIAISALAAMVEKPAPAAAAAPQAGCPITAVQTEIRP